MYRKFLRELESWEDGKVKEPLLVTGARQVGKTWLIKSFCEERYDDHVYINLEEQQSIASVFEGDLDPATLLRNIGILLGRRIDSNTAIFIDEIQVSERAINSLKYFCEAKENYRIICAGSLLGVKINRFQSSFPVGKVCIKKMHPMDLGEFLIACGEEQLKDSIKAAYDNMAALPQAIHEKALKLYHDYLIVGGMPQAVSDYIRNGKNIMAFNRDLLEYITLAYKADMAKYVFSSAESTKITSVYDSIPRQLARENPKFKYSEIKTTANKRDYYAPIDWLKSSGMVYKIDSLDSVSVPLKAYENSSCFKIYMSDVGLLCRMTGLVPADLMPDRDNTYKGAVVENYVFEQLAVSHNELYYFKPSDSMEIDVIIQIDNNVIPIEIKSGRHKRSVSLKNYMEKYEPAYSVRLSENNFGMANGIRSVPLYAVFCI